MGDKIKISYRLNKNNEYIDKGKKNSIAKKIDEGKFGNIRLYSNEEIAYIKVSPSMFKDDRNFSGGYWFLVKPGVPLYQMYEEYRKIIDSPDPLFGGSISKHNKDYEKLREDIDQHRNYMILLFTVSLQMFNSYLHRKIMRVNPISMRALWDIERIAYEQYGITFSYVIGEMEDHWERNFDIILKVDKGNNFYNFMVSEFQRNWHLIYEAIPLRLSREFLKDKKRVFFAYWVKRLIDDNSYRNIFEYIKNINGGVEK